MVAAPVLAQPPLPADAKGADKLQALIERMTEVQEATTSLEATFEQRKTSRMLAEPSVTSGKFYFRAPDDVRWEYTSPRRMSVLLVDQYAITYRPAEGRAERVELGRIQRKAFRFLGATEPVAELTRHFMVTLQDPGDGGNLVLLLDPTTPQIKKRLKQVRIEIDARRFLPVAVAYSEPDGDSTEYLFRDVVRNGELPAGLFRLDLPEGVEVVEMKLRSAD